jgi:carbon-monoxide dehydrogenase medium subunit
MSIGLAPFGYARPASVAEACALLAQDPDARLLAGGMTLLPTIKQRLARPSLLVDLGGVEALSGVRRDREMLWIGAMTRHADVADSELVQKAIPALAALADGIGDPHVRNRGTIGGSVANADPAADYPAAVLALGATVETSRREIPADDFFLGLYETALVDGEIVTGFRFRVPDLAGYVKFPNPASRYATVGVFVARFGEKVRMACTGAASHAFRLFVTEAQLEQDFRPEPVGRPALERALLNTDGHADAEYREHLVGVIAKRAVAAALELRPPA